MRIILIQEKDNSLEESMLLHLIRNNIDLKQLEETLYDKKLLQRGYPTIKGLRAIRDQFKIKEIDEEDLGDLTDEYRKKFSGLKPGVMGNRELLLKKLRDFKKQHPYTNEQILLAISNYINSERHSGYKYLQRADYTVSKVVGGAVESRLLTFCEELDNNVSNGEEDFFDVI